nr:non-ribosomal peptide synthetase [Rhodococcus sp. HNM0569]
MTGAQSGMWFAQRLDPSNPTFVTLEYLDVRGAFDAGTWSDALGRAVRESGTLTSRVAEDECGPAVEAHAWPVRDVDVIDLSSAPDPAAAADDRIRTRTRTPLDPSREPGFGCEVLALGRDRHRIVMWGHHVLIDVYGYSLLVRRAAALYTAARSGADAPRARFGKFEDVVAHDAAYRASDDRDQDAAFWSRALSGAADARTLSTAGPVDASRTARTVRTATVSVAGAARGGAGGWVDTVIAATAAYVARRTGAGDIVLGFPTMNRFGTPAGSVVTTAVNVVPLRVPVMLSHTLTEIAEAVHAARRSLEAHTRYRGEDIHRDLHVPAGHPGIVGPTVNVKPFGDSVSLPDCETTVHSVARGPVRDLAFVLRRTTGDDLEIVVDADADRYSDAETLRHAHELARMVEFAAGPAGQPGPPVPIAHAELTDRAAFVQWVVGAGTPEPAPDVLVLFDRCVAAHPDAEALVCGGERLTYADLARRVGRLAEVLASRGVGAGDLVALALPRSADTVAALLAVLRTGAGYVPLDPGFPPARLEFMLADASPRVLLAASGFADTVVIPGGTQFVDLATIGEPAPVTSAADAPLPGQCAYLIYTSGSTGRPKGVVLSRRALARFAAAAPELVDLGTRTRMLAVTTLSFDIAVLELLVPLTRGACVVLARDDDARDPAVLARLIRDEHVTCMQATPSLWSAVLEPGAGDADLSGVDVVVGGEALPTSLARELATRARSVVDMYGPTEATVWCTSTPVRAGEWNGSIGRPYPGTGVRVLDDALRPTPPGVTGELYVTGEQLAQGYRGRVDLTATRFVADPFGDGRMYRTGDLVRWNDDGALHYLGRADDQVKVRGHRVELGDVESAACAFDTVAHAVVTVRRDATGTGRLVGYVVPREGDSVDPAALTAHLRATVPAYMVPSAIVPLETFPLTPNLKVDRKALPEPDFAAEGLAPVGPVQTALADLVADVLGLPSVGADVDFFALGGTSLSATRLIGRIAREFAVAVTLREVFDAPTVAGLAEVVACAPPALPPIEPAARSDAAVVSFAQQRIWLQDRLSPGSAAFNIPLVVALTGEVDARRLAGAVDRVFARHDVLRSVTVEHDGLPAAQRRADGPSTRIVPVDDVDRARLLDDEIRRPFDLASEPPVRATVFVSSPARATLVVVFHHVAADEWSAGLFLDDLQAVWRGDALPALPVQYADFAAWQRRIAAAPEFGTLRTRLLGHWRHVLDGAPDELALPYDRVRPPSPSHTGGEVVLDLAAPYVRTVAEQAGVGAPAVASAAVAVLLSRLGAGRDVVLGAPVARRGRSGLEHLIGLFVDVLPLRFDLPRDATLRDAVEQAGTATLDAEAHADVQLEDIAAAVGATHSSARHPLFQTMVQYRAAFDEFALGATRASAEFVGTGTAKLDLTFEFVEQADGSMCVRIEYAHDVFGAETAEDLAERLHTVLAALAESPQRPVADLDVRTRRERARAQSGAAAHTPLLPTLLSDAYARNADRTALVCGDTTLTYRDLREWADRVAAALHADGIGPGSVVALSVPRGVEFVVALCGVLTAGAAVLPIDLDYPQARIDAMLSDARPDAALDRGDVRAVRSASAPQSVPVRDLRPDDAAYVLYTSGSTGTPKGVVGTAAALAERVAWQRDVLPVPAEGDVRLVKSSVAFVDGTTEVLAGLVAGARLVLSEPHQARDVDALADLIVTHRVRVLTAVPSLAATLADVRPDAARLVRTWFLSGEPLDAATVAALGATGAAVLNSYGSSEVAGDVAVWTADGGPRVLVGDAVPGTTLHVLDDTLAPVPDGVVGDLYVDGVQVARGYRGLSAQTAARFVAAPGGARLFRTGDLVRRTRSGALQFVGRADTQLSVRGFRIEPGEIEAALLAVNGVDAAAVDVRPSSAGDDMLVAYVAGSSVPDDDVLRDRLRTTLPDYMVPVSFVMLPELPTLPNGKLDRRALPEPSRGVSRVPHGVEIVYCDLLADLLGVASVGPDEDFFALGGNSLLAARLGATVRDRLGVELTMRDVFDARTAAGFARVASHAPARPPLRRGHSPEPTGAALSPAQRRLWFQFQLEGPSPTYTIAFALRLDGDLDLDALRGALGDVAARHETLRTTFAPGEDGLGVAYVHESDAQAVPFDQVDVAGAADVVGAADAELRARARHAFDLEHEWPLRAVLVRAAGREHHLLVLVHHIAADERSAHPLMSFVAHAYTARVRGTVLDVPPLPVQYRDFTRWQRELLGDPAEAGALVASQAEYWRARLDGVPDEIALPRDRPRPAESSYHGDAVHFTLDRDVHARLAVSAADAGVSMFMLVHAAVAVLLARMGAGEDVVVGTPVAGRPDPALDELVGFFVNTVVLRTDLAGDPTLRDVLARVRSADLDGFAHQDLPFEQLVDVVAPERSLSRHPIFQVLVQYRDPIVPIEMAGLTATPEFVETGTAKFDLTFELADAGDAGIRGRIEYATDLFDRASAQRVADRLVSVLDAIARDVDVPLSRIAAVPEAELDALRAAENGCEALLPTEGLGELFARQAAQTPDALALVVDETGDEWTYRTLDAAVDRLAAALRTASAGAVGPDAVVAVAVPRSAALVVTLLAVHRVGAAYLPLDPSYPAERLAFMTADANPALVVTAVGAAATGHAAPVLEVDESGAPAADGRDRARTPAAGDAAAYVLYTSGSTGTPKGVVVGQRAIANRLAWMQQRYALTAVDRVLQKTPSGFDVSVWEFFWPLVTGATLVLATPDGHRDPAYLIDVVRRRGVTTAHFVPSMLGAFLTELAQAPGPAPERAEDDTALPVRRLLCSGEALRPEHRASVDALARRGLLSAELHNLYGPTEAAVDVTATEIDPAGVGPVPIGTPITNTRTYVLDARLARVPVGVAGELYLGGVQLARGYSGRPGLTSERFVADPNSRGERLYRTGDIVRWIASSDGTPTLDYLGRADGQVKLRGLRVELGEIEATLAAHPTVAHAVALVRDGHVHAYVVPRPGVVIDTDAVLETASKTLPAYMIPSTTTVLDTLPLTANGKLDRAALPVVDAAHGRTRPDTPEEQTLCALVADVLRLPVGEVGPDDDFFMLGGDSITSMTLVNTARRAGISFAARDVFSARTPAGLVAVAEFPGESSAPAGQAPQSGPRDADEPGPFALTPALHRLREVPGATAAGRFCVAPTDGIDDDTLAAALRELVVAHDALRTRLDVGAHGVWALRTLPHLEVAEPAVLTDADPASALDAHAGRMIAARRTDAALEVAVHAAAADAASLEILRAQLEVLLAAPRGTAAARPAVTGAGFAARLAADAQDPALLMRLAELAPVLASGGGLGGDPTDRRAEYVCDPVTLDPGAAAAVPEPLVVAAVTVVLTRWTAAAGATSTVVAVGRDARPAVHAGAPNPVPAAPPAVAKTPDPAGVVGPFDVVVPVRVELGADPGEVAAHTEQALAADAGAAYSFLRYLNAQAAPAFAALATPEVAVTCARGVVSVDTGAPIDLAVRVETAPGGASVLHTRLRIDVGRWGEEAAHALVQAWPDAVTTAGAAAGEVRVRATAR